MDKKFIACGVGNAIVDVIVKVSFHDLVLLGLNKDESCLIDLDKKNKIKQFIKDKSPKVSCGGSIANSIFTLSSLYGNSAFIGALGDDNFGRTFIQELKNNNIAVSNDIIKNNVNTGVCFVFITPDAERTMAVFLGDCASISLSDSSKELIKKSQNLLLEMYPVSNDEAYRALKQSVGVAKNNNSRIVLSYSDKGVVDNFPDKIAEFTTFSDVIFCNYSEAQSFSKTKDVQSMINFFKSKNDDKTYIITLGKNGVVQIYNNHAIVVDAFNVEPVDLTGAGDMFLASYVYADSLNLSKEEALKKACYMSSKVICKYGARLDGDLKAIWNEI